MRRYGLLAVTVAALALALAGCGGGASTEGGPKTDITIQTRSAGNCDPGYVEATLPWGVKCLVHGELCKSGHDADYAKYDFKCVDGRLD
jgi:hypothetical protein